jgi:hypothetical protein
MKRLILLATLLAFPALAQPVVVERTPQESDTIVILLGRACRNATDQDWIQVCNAAVGQAQKELEARKPKPEPKKE